jgi:hypothetical protein
MCFTQETKWDSISHSPAQVFRPFESMHDYGMIKLYLNTLASINVSCFSWGASHNNYLQIKKYTH